MSDDPPPCRLTLQLPMKDQPPLTFQGVFPVTEQEWDYIIGLLDVLKPGLVIPVRGSGGQDQ